MNQACHRGGKLLLNEQCACSANSASCCVAPCLTRRRCRVLGGGGGENSRVPRVPWGCAGVQWGRGRAVWLLEAARCQDASQQTAVLRCWGSSISVRWGVSCRAL